MDAIVAALVLGSLVFVIQEIYEQIKYVKRTQALYEDFLQQIKEMEEEEDAPDSNLDTRPLLGKVDFPRRGDQWIQD